MTDDPARHDLEVKEKPHSIWWCVFCGRNATDGCKKNCPTRKTSDCGGNCTYL